MKTEMKIIKISSKVLSKVKSQLSYPPLNLKRILEDNNFIMVCMVTPWIRCKSCVTFVLIRGILTAIAYRVLKV